MKEKERERSCWGKKPVKVKSLGQYESLLPNLALPKTCLRRPNTSYEHSTDVLITLSNAKCLFLAKLIVCPENDPQQTEWNSK